MLVQDKLKQQTKIKQPTRPVTKSNSLLPLVGLVSLGLIAATQLSTPASIDILKPSFKEPLTINFGKDTIIINLSDKYNSLLVNEKSFDIFSFRNFNYFKETFGPTKIKELFALVPFLNYLDIIYEKYPHIGFNTYASTLTLITIDSGKTLYGNSEYHLDLFVQDKDLKQLIRDLYSSFEKPVEKIIITNEDNDLILKSTAYWPNTSRKTRVDPDLISFKYVLTDWVPLYLVNFDEFLVDLNRHLPNPITKEQLLAGQLC